MSFINPMNADDSPCECECRFGFFVPFLEHVDDLDGLMDYVRQRLTIGPLSSSSLLSSVKLGDTKVYDPEMRARIGPPPLYLLSSERLQGCLAHKKRPPP